MTENNDERLKKILTQIEEVRSEVTACRIFINSHLLNLSETLKTSDEKIMLEEFERDLNNLENARDKLEKLIHIELTNYMKDNKMPGTGKDLLDSFDQAKKDLDKNS